MLTVRAGEAERLFSAKKRHPSPVDLTPLNTLNL
jgi:hypothetical protein